MSKRVGYNYAKALFEVADKQNMHDKFYMQLQNFNQILQSNTILKKRLISPIIKFNKKLIIVNAMCKYLKIVQDVERFIACIIKDNKISIFMQIHEAYKKLLLDLNGKKLIIVKTPIPMSVKLRKQITQELSETLNKKIELVEKVDSSLISGIIINIDDYFFDTSIHNKLKILQRKIAI